MQGTVKGIALACLEIRWSPARLRAPASGSRGLETTTWRLWSSPGGGKLHLSLHLSFAEIVHEEICHFITFFLEWFNSTWIFPQQKIWSSADFSNDPSTAFSCQVLQITEKQQLFLWFTVVWVLAWRDDIQDTKVWIWGLEVGASKICISQSHESNWLARSSSLQNMRHYIGWLLQASFEKNILFNLNVSMRTRFNHRTTKQMYAQDTGQCQP